MTRSPRSTRWRWRRSCAARPEPSGVRLSAHPGRGAWVGVKRDRLTREPASIVHNDYTARSGPKRLRDHFDQDEADVLLRRRFAIVNVWRSTRGTVRTAP